MSLSPCRTLPIYSHSQSAIPPYHRVKIIPQPSTSRSRTDRQTDRRLRPTVACLLCFFVLVFFVFFGCHCLYFCIAATWRIQDEYIAALCVASSGKKLPTFCPTIPNREMNLLDKSESKLSKPHIANLPVQWSCDWWRHVSPKKVTWYVTFLRDSWRDGRCEYGWHISVQWSWHKQLNAWTDGRAVTGTCSCSCWLFVANVTCWWLRLTCCVNVYDWIH